MSDDRLKIWIDLFKWLLASVALVVVGMIIDSGFRDREINTKEMEHYNTYLNYVTDDKLIGEMMDIAEFYKTITISDPIRKRWTLYYDLINSKYIAYQQQQKSLKDTVTKMLSVLTKMPADSIAVKRKLEIAKTQLEYLNTQVASVQQPQAKPINIESAAFFEAKGVDALVQGNLSAASLYFGKSDKVFPTYHSSFEIKKSIDQTIPDYNNANTSTKLQLLDSLSGVILGNYAWKMDDVNRRKIEQLQGRD